MPEWADVIAHASWATSSIWLFLQSNFSTAVLGSLAGAFGGAWAAQKIADRTKLREELLKEIRNTNAAATMIYGIANSHLGLKKQHVKRLYEKYHEERVKLELFLKAQSAGRVPPRQVFEFEADMQTLKPLYSPTDQIQKLVFDQISIKGPVLFVAPILLQSIQSLGEQLTERNRLIEEFKENRPLNPYVYFGMRQENHVVDQRYLTAVNGIHNLTDDVITFSIMIGDALYDHGIAQRKRYREKFRDEGPTITRMQFSKVQDLLPPPDEFKDFNTMFQAATPASDEQVRLLQRIWPFRRRAADTPTPPPSDEAAAE